MLAASVNAEPATEDPMTTLPRPRDDILRKRTGKPKVNATAPERPVESLLQELEDLHQTVSALYAREALLDSVIQSLPLWITVKDAQDRYLLVNQAMADAHGLRPEHFVGKQSADVLKVERSELDALATLGQMVRSSGRSVERPAYVVKRPDGEEQVRRLIKMPLRDADGSLLGIVAWSEDITERAKAEATLDQQRRLLQTVFNTIPHPLSYSDYGRRLRMVNKAFCDALRLGAKDVVGRTIMEVKTIPRHVRQALWDQTTEIYEKGSAGPSVEHVYPTTEGGKVYAQVSKAPIVFNDKVEGVVTVSVDVTPLRVAEQQSRLAHQRLHDALDSIPAAIYLYDAGDRLITANTMAKSMYPAVAPIMQPGTPFRDLLSAVADTLFKDQAARVQFVERRLREFRDNLPRVEQLGPGGRHLLGHDARTTEGGTVSIRFDITEQKRIQQQLELRDRQNRTELVLAAQLQQSILRGIDAPRYLVEAHEFRPSTYVSGDMFHAGMAADGSFLFFLGDATGHGVGAALVTMLVAATLSDLSTNLAPREMADRLNDRLLSYHLESMYMSGVFLRITPRGELSVANAGHPDLLVLGGLDRRVAESSGPPMGWFAAPGYQDARFQLAPGDKIVLFSDGLTEWGSASGAQFGSDALERMAREQAGLAPAELVQSLVNAAAAHAEGQECADDLTLFVLEYRVPT